MSNSCTEELDVSAGRHRRRTKFVIRVVRAGMRESLAGSCAKTPVFSTTRGAGEWCRVESAAPTRWIP
jgi:hypothetical protein